MANFYIYQQILWQLILYGLTAAKITHVAGLESKLGLENVATKSIRHAANAVVNDILVVIVLSYQRRVWKREEGRGREGSIVRSNSFLCK